MYDSYSYGVAMASRFAQSLGYEAITVIELGVAGGEGLTRLERLAAFNQSMTGVRVDVAGFDLQTGLPAPRDYRDLPYVWREGFFRMDEAKLRAKLTRADLRIGDVGETLAAFLDESSSRSPVGFIAFDLDFYSSTSAALNAIADADPEQAFAPRVLCYFDDIIGSHEELHCEYAGELLAINEFNERAAHRKLAKVNGLWHKLSGSATQGRWCDEMYALHWFEHSRYADFVGPNPDWQLPLGWSEAASRGRRATPARS